MKTKKLLQALVLLCSPAALPAQNYLDQYLTDPLTYTTVISSTNGLNQPRDLDFKPNTNELWVANKGGSNGGSVVVVYNAGFSGQTSQYRKDSHSSHFMIYPSAIAFSDIGQWACVNEIQSTGGPTSTFMGPALWSADTSIFARAFQNNWVSALPLGSHLDMLHQSPFSMGIAHDSALAYWVADGHNGNICRYDFSQHHGPGYEDHSAGKIYRYTDVPFSRTTNIPGHMILDKATGWLYYIDSGTKMLKRMNTNTGAISGTLTVPATANEPLAGYWAVTGAVQETIDTFLTQVCGIDVYNGRLIVGDNTNGNIYLYDVSGPSPVFMDTIATGQAGMEGLKIGPDGKIWFVNNSQNTVVRIDPLPAPNDASIEALVAPLTENFLTGFYSIAFNQCAGSITPVVKLTNAGSNPLNSATINYVIDNGPVNAYSWTGTLAPGASVSVTLPAISMAQGEHLLTAYTSNPNGSADDNPANDSKAGAFRLLDPVAAYPFTEGFASPAFPPAGWSYIHYNPNNEMTRVTNTGGFGNSSECVKMDHYSGAEDITGQLDYLMTPGIDLSNAANGTTLEFSVAYSQYTATSDDRLFVKISTDCGATWSVIYNVGGSALATTALHTSAYNAPLPSEWRRESINLNAYIGQPNVIFMFETESNYGNNMFLDDIQVMNTTTVAEQQQENNVSVYPNPSNGLVIVETTLPGSAAANITVTNMLGEIVIGRQITGAQHGRFTLDMSGFPAGTYFVTVQSETAETTTKKIVIQH